MLDQYKIHVAKANSREVSLALLTFALADTFET